MLTLKTAKKLKEVGWSKSVSYIYAISGSGKSQIFRATPFINAKIKETEYYYPCPSLEELFAEMPSQIETAEQWEDNEDMQNQKIISNHYFAFNKTETDYVACYERELYDGYYSINFKVINPDPTEAAAQLYIKLKEEKLC